MKDFNLRPYQIEALNVIHEDLKEEQFVLFQAIMGSGKTVMIARLINRYWFETDRRFLILAHKGLLVEQFFQTFKDMTDVPIEDIGICSAGLNERVLGKRLTISTVQTFINVEEHYPGADLVVIDECHKITIGTGSQYDQVIDSLQSKVPNMRLIGISATPFRLDHGFCYGDKCRPGNKNLFPRLNYQIKYNELRKQGYLCELRGKIAHADCLVSDLADVKVNGDYVLNELGDVMVREVHLTTAVEAIKEHCSDYKMICIFATTIQHAEMLKDLLSPECTTIHSQLSPLERQINMANWKSGKTRICTSINILAEGFDFPPLDCLVFARPTLSSTLFLQAVGRALRISPGKDHGFLLDLTDNSSRFGVDLDHIRVNIPKAVVKDILKKDPLCKLCPNCEKECFINLKTCPHCGFDWPVAEIIEANHVPELTEVTFEEKKPMWVDVTDMYINIHESRKNGKFLIQIEFMTGAGMSSISEWFCLSDFYEGYAVVMAQKKWDKLVGHGELPKTVDEFAKYNIVAPERILIDANAEYPDVLEYEFIEPPF